MLHRAAWDEIEERLAEVNRRFTAPAVVSGFPALWSALTGFATSVPDDAVLALEPGAHDLVIHALALHWANDPVGQLVQARRALRPDGLLIACLFGGRTLAPLRAALAEAEIAVTGGLSPRVLPMGELRDLGGLLARAGLALPVADAQILRIAHENGLHLLHDLRAMGETNALAARHRRIPPRALFGRALAQLDAGRGADGRLTQEVEMIFLTGWAPDASQPRPLAPGSAQMRLSDALGVTEYGADPAPRD